MFEAQAGQLMFEGAKQKHSMHDEMLSPCMPLIKANQMDHAPHQQPTTLCRTDVKPSHSKERSCKTFVKGCLGPEVHAGERC